MENEDLKLKIQNFYSANNYPNLTTYAPYKIGQICSPFASFAENLKENILVVGCGVIEANLVAYHQPNSFVVGMDFSRPSIAISKSFRRKYKLKNLAHRIGDFLINDFIEGSFDRVIASGVLHHMPDIDEALQQVSRVLRPDGFFGGMVYSDRRPKRIRELSRFFLDSGFTVKQVKHYLENIKDEWYSIHDRSDIEVADTWLNPHFNEHSKEEFREKLIGNGFHTTQLEYEGFEGSKLMFTARRQ